MKHLIIIISVLLAFSVPAAAFYPFYPVKGDRVAADTAVTPVGDPEFLENIFACGSSRGSAFGGFCGPFLFGVAILVHFII